MSPEVSPFMPASTARAELLRHLRVVCDDASNLISVVNGGEFTRYEVLCEIKHLVDHADRAAAITRVIDVDD